MQINLKPLLKLAAAHGQATAILVAVFVASAGFAGWLHEHDGRIRDSVRLTDSLTVLRAEYKSADSARRVADSLRTVAAAQLAAISVITVRDSTHVTQAGARLDSTLAMLPQKPKTRADTNSAIAALPTIRRQADSLKRACSDQVVSCADYRRQTAILLHADTTTIADRDAMIGKLRAQLVILPRLDATKPPSKWSTVERWGERLAIACGAYSLGAKHLCWRR